MTERVPFLTHNFSLVVCRNNDGKLLAVKETRNRGWWLPAGLVEQGETFVQAAHREVMEEAGIRVDLKGVLRVEHSVYGPTQARMRVIFFAVPLDPNHPVKKKKDKESEEACWVTLDELKALARGTPGLRGPELYEWGNYIEKGGIIAPIHILCREDERTHTEALFFKVQDPNSSLDVQTLITAIENGDESNTRKQLILGVDPNIPINEKLWTPLHLACHLQHESIVYLLLVSGGNPEAVTHKARSVLHFAAQTTLPILSMVLTKLSKLTNKSFAVNHQDYNGDTPLHFAAACSRDGPIWRALVKHGADDKIPNRNLVTPSDLI